MKISREQLFENPSQANGKYAIITKDFDNEMVLHITSCISYGEDSIAMESDSYYDCVDGNDELKDDQDSFIISRNVGPIYLGDSIAEMVEVYNLLEAEDNAKTMKVAKLLKQVADADSWRIRDALKQMDDETKNDLRWRFENLCDNGRDEYTVRDAIRAVRTKRLTIRNDINLQTTINLDHIVSVTVHICNNDRSLVEVHMDDDTVYRVFKDEQERAYQILDLIYG